MTSAGSVVAARPGHHQTSGGASPTSALQQLRVKPAPFRIAKALLVENHYLHSMPGGTRLAFGVFVERHLLGALTLGCGPANAYRLVDAATADDCVTLTRLWLSDELPPNSESRVIGVVLRSLRRHTAIKFLLSYADPTQGHVGTIYKASGWTYTGLSASMPLYSLGGGKPRHSRSLSHAFGTHSTEYFKANGVPIKAVPQSSKHRYVYFLDRSWQSKLQVPTLPYPKKESSNEHR